MCQHSRCRPSFFKTDKYLLTPSALAVYVCICHEAEHQHSNCEFSSSPEELAKVTGYAERQVKRALVELADRKFIATAEAGSRDEVGQFMKYNRVMTNPTREGRSMAQALREDRREHSSLRSILFAVENQAYFSAPKAAVPLLVKIKGTPLVVYVCLSYRSHHCRKLQSSRSS